jgi:hypothetical protein
VFPCSRPPAAARRLFKGTSGTRGDFGSVDRFSDDKPCWVCSSSRTLAVNNIDDASCICAIKQRPEQREGLETPMLVAESLRLAMAIIDRQADRALSESP